MKKALIFLFLFSSLHSKSQSDSLAIEFPQLTDSTSIGAPDGKSVNKEIGLSGGKIISEDGRIELLFPAGALTETKTISIQPTVNLAPNGSGKSYWFEPSGIHFKKPVQLTFHYSDEEVEECHPDLMGLAIQDHNGKWSFVYYDNWDSVNKTLTGTIHHFSGASNVYMLRLKPRKQEVCAGKTVDIDVMEYNEGFGISVEAFFKPGQKNHWYVNQVEWGNEKFGFIQVGETVEKAIRTMTTQGLYIAPKKFIKKDNPVQVAVLVKIPHGKRKGQYRPVSCRIWVYDMYRISVIHVSEHRAGMGNEVTDSANFIVKVYPNEIKITNINNYPPSLTKPGKKGPCKLKMYFDGADGLVHITEGYHSLKISDDDPPEVLFLFLSQYQRLIDRFSWSCPGGVNTPIENMYAVPIVPEINFITNGEVQRINTDDTQWKYKTIIVPVR